MAFKLQWNVEVELLIGQKNFIFLTNIANLIIYLNVIVIFILFHLLALFSHLFGKIMLKVD
jgi:hypothetical protein